jgi:WD40 repeat protein
VTSPDLAPELRDVATSELLARLDGPTFAWGAVVEPGGTWAVSVGNAGLVVWDLREHRAVGVLPGVEAVTEGLAASGAEPVLVTADGDRTVRVWDVREGAPPEAPPAREVRSLDVRAGRCVAGFPSGPPAAWALVDGADLPVADADLHARRTTIVSGQESAPSRDGRRRARASWHVPMLGMFTWSEVTGRDEYLPAVIEVLADGEIVTTLEDPCAPLTALALSADGGRVLAASWDGTVAVYHVADGVFVRRLPVGTALAGAAPVTGGRTRGAWLDTLVAANAAVSAVAATWDDRLVVATRNGSLQEWDLATGLQLAATVLEAPASLLALDDTDESLLLADERGRVTCLTRHPG